VKDGKAQSKSSIKKMRDKGTRMKAPTAANLKNAIHGVTTGWKKELEIAGTGYRAR
jgi:ribosomal protein L6P/L9E